MIKVIFFWSDESSCTECSGVIVQPFRHFFFFCRLPRRKCRIAGVMNNYCYAHNSFILFIFVFMHCIREVTFIFCCAKSTVTAKKQNGIDFIKKKCTHFDCNMIKVNDIQQGRQAMQVQYRDGFSSRQFYFLILFFMRRQNVSVFSVLYEAVLKMFWPDSFH